MHQKSGLHMAMTIFRLFVLVMGFVLFFVFGARAMHDAQDPRTIEGKPRLQVATASSGAVPVVLSDTGLNGGQRLSSVQTVVVHTASAPAPSSTPSETAAGPASNAHDIADSQVVPVAQTVSSHTPDAANAAANNRADTIKPQKPDKPPRED